MLFKMFSSIPIIELLGKILAFTVIILMTHLLSIEDMGTYSIIVSLVMISSVFMDGGVNNKIYTSILQGKDNKLSDYYSQKIIFSFITIICITIYAYFTYNFWIDILLYILMTFFVSQIILYKFIYRANQNINWDIITILIDPIIKLLTISIIYFSKISISLWSILLIFLVISILEYMVVNKYFKIHYNNFSFIRPQLKKFIETLNEIKYFIIFYFIYILYQRIDIFFIEIYLDKKSVAIYFSAYNIYTALIIVITTIVSHSFPLVKNNRLTEQLFYFRKYLIIYIFSLCLAYFILPTVYLIIYPQKYSEGSEVLFWLLLAMPFVFITYLTIFNFNFLAQEKFNIYPILFLLFLKIGSFYFLISFFHNIVIFVKSYVVFEFILSILFLSIFYKWKEKNNV